ncbi:nucleotide-binding alpha-beta plait domain-containing protein [Tanacetum coccineum]|uniref:Nucleotide-binding alpha-beta plait domain-containing protein n=1 Tax=Tanacetum coccineum TaxID=301880 RepID=A0ABQ5FBA8_9ASTR
MALEFIADKEASRFSSQLMLLDLATLNHSNHWNIFLTVLQQLAQYGIEHIEMIRVPEDIAYNKMVKVGDTKTRSTLCTVLGRDVSAKVSFEQSAKPSNDEDVPQVNRVHMAGLAKDWDEEKVKEICEKYGEIVNIDLHQSSKPKHKDFGFHG